MTAAPRSSRPPARDGQPFPWGRNLVRPAPLAAMALLLLNDHVFKGMPAAPSFVTGKLSDLAGLFFFPVFLVALVEVARAVVRRPHDAPANIGLGAGVATTAAVLTAVVFSCFELIPALAEAVSPWMKTTPDPTDLLALPMVALSWWWLRRQASRVDGSKSDGARAVLQTVPGTSWRLAGLIAAAAASAATSRLPTPSLQPPPTWTVGGPIGRAGCATVEPWISKSGRQGVGVTVRLRSVQDTCVVTLSGAAVVVEGTAHRAASLPAAVTVGRGGPAHVYLAFPFDNLRAWKEQRNKGELVLTFVDAGTSRAGAATTLRYPMVQWQPPTPGWDVLMPERQWSCAQVELSISGDEPGRLTATLRLRSAPGSPPCKVTIIDAQFSNAGTMVKAAELPVPLTLGPDRLVTVELAFALVRPPARSESTVIVQLANEAGESTTQMWSLTPVASDGGADALPTGSVPRDGGVTRDERP